MNAEPGGIDADQIDACFTQTGIANTRTLSRSDLPAFRPRLGLHGSSALSTIRIREALTFWSIKAP